MAFLLPYYKTLQDGHEILLRSAKVADAAGLLAYIKTVTSEAPFLLIEADEFNIPVEQERHWVQEHLDRPGWIAVVAEAGGGIVGVLNFENGTYRRTAHRGSFGVSVLQSWRNRGIGSALLEIFLHWAAENPLIEKVGMEVVVENTAAIRLYKRHGFVEESVKRNELKLGPNRYADTVSMYRFVKPF